MLEHSKYSDHIRNGATIAMAATAMAFAFAGCAEPDDADTTPMVSAVEFGPPSAGTEPSVGVTRAVEASRLADGRNSGESSSFDDSPLGWTIWGDAQGPSVDPTFVAGFGTPSGSIEATDDEAGGVWFWRAPSSFWSDKVDPKPDPRLRYDLRQSGKGPLFDACDVVLVDDDRGACLVGSRVPAATFTPYIVRFRVGDEDWREISVVDGFPTDTGNPGAPLHQPELDAIVGSIDELLIRGEFITGPDVGGLDNVRLGSVAG